jgi:hypothetical protein
MKECLIGRRIIFDIDNESLEELQVNHLKVVKCDIVGNLKEEKWRRFKFKFRRRGRKCNQLEALRKILKVSKKKFLKLCKLSKERWKCEEKENWREGEKIHQKDLKGKLVNDAQIKRWEEENEELKQDFRPLMDKSNHQLTFRREKINVMTSNSREMITESERGYQVNFSLCAQNGRTTHVEQCYKFLLKENNQNVHGKEFVGVLFLYQQRTRSSLETEIGSKARIGTLMGRILNGLRKMIDLYSRRARHDNLKFELFWKRMMLSDKKEVSFNCNVVNNASPMVRIQVERELKTIEVCQKGFKMMMEAMENNNQMNMKGAVFYYMFDNFEAKQMGMNLVIMGTEGRKGVLSREFVSTEDKGVSHLRLGYFIMKTNNNQKAQREGI